MENTWIMNENLILMIDGIATAKVKKYFNKTVWVYWFLVLTYSKINVLGL